MSKIILRDVHDEEGKYLGREVIYLDDLTPELLDAIKKDKDNKMGWKQHHTKLKEEGYDVE